MRWALHSQARLAQDCTTAQHSNRQRFEGVTPFHAREKADQHPESDQQIWVGSLGEALMSAQTSSSGQFPGLPPL